MQYQFARWGVVFLLLIALMCGCGGGGGGGGGAVTPIPVVPAGSSLTIATTTAFAGGTRAGKDGTTVSAPLDAGAVIDVYDFSTGLKLTTGTLGADGKGTVTVTAGLNVVIVVTGTRAGKSYRLSLVLPAVPSTASEVVADPVSTISAEALARIHFTKSKVTSGMIDTVKAAAEAYLAAHPDADLSLGALIKGTGFGLADSMDGDSLKEVIDSVPAMPDGLGLAKNAVQQIKEAGAPWREILDRESLSLEGMFTAVDTAVNAMSLDAITSKYSELGSRLSKLISPVIFGQANLVAGGPVQNGVTLLDLTLGSGYRAESVPVFGGEDQLVLYPEASFNVPGQITIKLEGMGGIKTLVAKPVDGINWTVTQTSTGDSELEYTATGPVSAPGANPSLTGSFSVKDHVITTPITFNGTASATGTDVKHYTSAVFEGTLSSAEVQASGHFSASFLSAVPAGAFPDQEIYDFPTAVALTNGSITVNAAGAVAEIKGNISGTMTTQTIGGRPRTVPTAVSLSGGSIAANNGTDKSVLLTGDITATLAPITHDWGWDVAITEMTAGSIAVKFQVNGKEVNAAGSLTGKGTVVTSHGQKINVPTEVHLSGSYSNTDTKLTFSGSINGTWENAAGVIDIIDPKGSVAVKGSVQREGYESFTVDMSCTGNGAGGYSFTVTNLGWASKYLTGSATIVNDPITRNVVSQTIDLTNQDGVLFHIGLGMSGKVSVAGVDVATIAEEGNMLKVVFSDGYFEYL